jgi:glycosyltransferase involved in cell wall biosynthesis
MACETAVILPTYNRADWLEESIRSVLAQTVSDFQLWVVDDGSTDQTPAALERFAGRIHAIRLEQNRGVAFARNTAIRASKSRWVAFLDSDDLWRPTRLERQLALARERPEAVLIHTEETWIRDGAPLKQLPRHAKSGGDIFRRSLRLVLVSPSSALIRRDVLDEIGLFNEALPAAEDYDLWLRILCRHPAHFVDEPLVVKRGGHPDQLSRRIAFLDRYRIRALLDLLNSGALSPRQRGWVIDELTYKCEIFGKGCLKHGKTELGKRFLALPRRFAEEG